MFNKYDMRVNVVNDTETKQNVEAVLEALHNSLVLSLGPYGSTAIIHDPQVGHYMTKDGFTILGKIRFNSPVMQTILDIIREASQKLVMKVGDGSTTSIIAANFIYTEILQLMKEGDLAGVRPKDVIDFLKEAAERIIAKIKEFTKPISEDLKEIDHIATVSLNNDAKLGKLIGDIYREVGLDGFVHIKLSKTNQSHYETEKGFQVDGGYLDKMLVNTETDECRINNANVIMFDGVLHKEDEDVLTAALNHTIVEANNGGVTGLMIIAPGISAEISAWLRRVVINNFGKSNVRNIINVIKFPLGTDDDIDRYNDLAIVTGSMIVKNSMGDRDFDITSVMGKVDEITSNYKQTVFTGYRGDAEEIAIRKGTINAERQRMKDEQIIDHVRNYQLQKRLAVLEGNLVTLFVGGNSDHEKATTKYLIDDAVAACKSALKHGYVIGCNLAIPIAIDELLEEPMDAKAATVLKAIRKAFFNVFGEVYTNKYSVPSLSEEAGDAFVKDTETRLYAEEIDEYKSAVLEHYTQIEEVFNKCVAERKAFNLITEEFTETEIINSAETEIEILRNVISIMSLLTLSNQFVTTNADSLIYQQ